MNILIVLGNKLLKGSIMNTILINRLNKANKLYHKNKYERIIVSGGNLAATAPEGLAGNLAILFEVSNRFVVFAPPVVPAVNAIAEVDKYCPDVNLKSPSTIPTMTLFSNKLPSV